MAIIVEESKVHSMILTFLSIYACFMFDHMCYDESQSDLKPVVSSMFSFCVLSALVCWLKSIQMQYNESPAHQ